MTDGLCENCNTFVKDLVVHRLTCGFNAPLPPVVTSLPGAPDVMPVDMKKPLVANGTISFIPKMKGRMTTITEPVYVLYEHWHENKLIYLGMTEVQNMFRCPDARSNPYWDALVKENDSIIVNVLMIAKRHVVVNEWARRMNRRDKPFCNNYVQPPRRHGNAIICSDGRVFKSQAEAAIALGVPHSRVSYHMNGKAGYKSIKGLTLKYHE